MTRLPPSADEMSRPGADDPSNLASRGLSNAPNLALPERPRDGPISGVPSRLQDSRRDHPTSPRMRRGEDDPGRPTSAMPPPAGPSTKPLAQDLRVAARTGPDTEDADSRSSRRRRSHSPVRKDGRSQSTDSRDSTLGKADDRDDRKSRDHDGRDKTEGRRNDRTRTRDDEPRRSDRDRDRERDKDHDRERDTSRTGSGRDRDRERGDRHRRDRDAGPSRKERDRGTPTEPAASRGRREEEAPSGREDGSRARPTMEDNLHKRRREEEVICSSLSTFSGLISSQENLPSKRARDNGLEPRTVPTEPARDRPPPLDTRDGDRTDLRRYSPNGRDRYREESDREASRRTRESARDGARMPPRDDLNRGNREIRRSSMVQTGTEGRNRDMKELDAPLEKEKLGRGDRADDGRREERTRRDLDRDPDRNRIDGTTNRLLDMRDDRRERDEADFPTDDRSSELKVHLMLYFINCGLPYH